MDTSTSLALSRPATMPPPAAPSRKRRRSGVQQSSAPKKRARKAVVVPQPSPEPEFETVTLDHVSSGWVALKFVQVSSLEDVDIEDSNDDRDDQLQVLSLEDSIENLDDSSDGQLQVSPLEDGDIEVSNDDRDSQIQVSSLEDGEIEAGDIEDLDDDREGQLALSRLSIAPDSDDDRDGQLALSRLSIIPDSDTERDISSPSGSANIKSENADTEDIWNIDGLNVRALMGGTFRNKGSRYPPKFSANQEKMILLWMKVNQSRGKGGPHRESFRNLIRDLRFSGRGHSKDVENKLVRKVETKFRTLYADLKHKDILEDDEARKSRDVNAIKFKPWTDIWLREDWDGSIQKPVGAETVDVDHEFGDDELSDDAAEEIVVEEPVSHAEPTKSRNRSGTRQPVIQSVESPNASVLNQVNDAWENEIIDLQAKSSSPELMTRAALHVHEWNTAAVQSQYAGINISDKELLAKDNRTRSESENLSGDEFTFPALPRLRTESNSRTVRPTPASLYAILNTQSDHSASTVIMAHAANQTITNMNEADGLAERIQHMSVSPAPPSYSNYRDDEVSEAGDNHSIHGDTTISDIDTEVEANIENRYAATDDELESYVDEEDNTLTPTRSPNDDNEGMSFTSSPPVNPDFYANLPLSPPPTATFPNHNGILYEIIPLTSTSYQSYQSWKAQLQALLLVFGLWNVITTGQGSDKDKDTVLGWMLLTMGSDARDAVVQSGIMDPVTLWGTLWDEFEDGA